MTRWRWPAWLRRQAMVGLPSPATPVVTVIRSAMREPMIGGDPVIDLLFGFVVAPAEAVADSGERVFGLGQGALAGVGDRGGLFGGPDVGDAQPVGGAGVVVGDVAFAQHAFPHGAGTVGQASLTSGSSGRGWAGRQGRRRRRRQNHCAQPVSARSGTTNRSPTASAAHSCAR